MVDSSPTDSPRPANMLSAAVALRRGLFFHRRTWALWILATRLLGVFRSTLLSLYVAGTRLVVAVRPMQIPLLPPNVVPALPAIPIGGEPRCRDAAVPRSPIRFPGPPYWPDSISFDGRRPGEGRRRTSESKARDGVDAVSRQDSRNCCGNRIELR